MFKVNVYDKKIFGSSWVGVMNFDSLDEAEAYASTFDTKDYLAQVSY
jgi:hypothetical protein